MTLEEILKEKGIENPQEILEEMHKNNIFLSKEENLDIRYGKLKEKQAGTESQLNEANTTINELKKTAKSNAELQSKIAEYEQKVKDLEEEARQVEQLQKINGALLKEGAEDVDYLNYLLSKKEDFNIDNLDAEIKELKDNNPKFFKKDTDKKYLVNKLKDGSIEKVTKEDFAKYSYSQRAELKESNPELYQELRGDD